MRWQLLLYSARETLVSLGVIVFEADLEFYGLYKFALFLVVGGGEKFLDGASHACH